MIVRLAVILLSLSFLIPSCSLEQERESEVKSSSENVTNDESMPVRSLPLDKCIGLYSQRLDNEVTAKKFCSCFMAQASESFKEVTILNFMEDRLEQLNDKELLSLTELYEACFSMGLTSGSAKFVGYSPEIVEVLKQTIKLNLEQANLDKEYNIDILTNCLVEAIQQNFTVGEVISSNIMESPEFQTLQGRCADEAKL